MKTSITPNPIAAGIHPAAELHDTTPTAIFPLESIDHFSTDDRATDAKSRGLTDITPAKE